jgi:quinohemoprotein ethanol dehydrogenase
VRNDVNSCVHVDLNGSGVQFRDQDALASSALSPGPCIGEHTSTNVRRRWGSFAAVLMASLVSSLLNAQSPAAASNLDWLHYGNDLANSRFQDVDQITPLNVSKLKPVWIFHTGVLDPLASLETSPIVANGTIFITTGHDDVFALDASTGKKLWEHHPIFLAPFDKLSICCGRVNRGVSFGNGVVFLARLDGVLEALDAITGQVLWQTVVVDYHERYSITMAPQFVSGLVIVGSSGGEYKVRGQVAAFDANTGAEVWRTFTTLPDLSWPGFAWKHGGGTVWQTPAIDAELGLIYINTGNPSADIYGADRIGDNRLTSSIVALHILNGKLEWNFQEVHHDMWDYDAAQPAVLFNVIRGGQNVAALGQCGKNGNYYVLDRRTGKPVFPVTEVAVPNSPEWQHASPTQPVSAVEPLTPLSILPGTIDFSKLPNNIQVGPQYTVPQKQMFLMQPGAGGGCEFPPAAYSPRTKFVYYGTRYEPVAYHTFPGDTGPNGGGAFLGSTFHGKIPGVTDFGIFGATDTTTGKVAWKIEVAQPAKSGLLVAGDLVFFGEGNGKFHAVDASTGRALFAFDPTGIPNVGGAQAAPIAYVVNGREFIVNAFGGNSADRPNFPPNPGGDAVIAFGLPDDNHGGGR